MTRLPADNWDVKGIDGPKYRVGPKCSVADCDRWADHAHHIWRRSFLTGDYRWVELWDGTQVQNLCGLCFEHHELITKNEAKIIADFTEGGQLTFTYTDDEGGWPCVLVPQPKTLDIFNAGERVDENVVAEREEPPCPTCGRRKHRSREDLPPGEKRNRVSWTVSVPKDERENGAEMLDELEFACAEKLGRADHASHKYYTLAEVMATFLLGNVEVSDFES